MIIDFIFYFSIIYNKPIIGEEWMADKDLSLKDYLADASVFADIFNLAFRRSGFVVDPKDLREVDSVQVMATPLKKPVSRAGGGVKTVAYRERLHDVLKMMVLEEDGKRKEILLGIEGQSKRARYMPLRIWQYEDQTMAWAMKRHVARRRGEPPLPGLISVVLYMRPGKWPGAVRLSQLQQRPKGRIRQYMNDVRMNVLTVEEISRHDIDSFYSEIGVIANAIVYADNPRKLWRILGKSKKAQHLSVQAAGVINEYTNLGLEVQEEQECVNMCNAKEFWMKEGEKKSEKKWLKKGEKKGIRIGREQGIKIGEERTQKKMLKQGIQLEIEEVVMLMRELNSSFEEIIKRLQKRYQLSRHEAMRQAKKAMA